MEHSFKPFYISKMALVDDKENDLRPINSGYMMRNYTEEYELNKIVSTCMYMQL